jgi:hypothetical protein
MKRDELLRRVARMARRQGVAWRLERQGANHEIWRCGSTYIPIPRHVEFGNGVAFTVFEDLEAELGKDRWRE